MCWALLLVLVVVRSAVGEPCPGSTSSLRSVVVSNMEGRSPTVEFVSHIDAELEVYWVTMSGEEEASGTIEPLSDTVRTSYVGHAFRVKHGDATVAEHVVTADGKQRVEIPPCGELPGRVEVRSESARDAEFEGLAHDALRECVGPSKNWSCVRYLTMDDLALRIPEEYGIQPSEGRAYATVDTGYVKQIPRIPQVTRGPGYLKMSFTGPLHDLADWYVNNSFRAKSHGTIPGGYTNNDKVEIHKLSLDEYPAVHRKVIREMRQILEWWTQLKLRHTSTFGVRIYRRGSTLINHVDRMDTHLASAVIQLHQDADEGWPLELYLPHQRVAEVYLQPRELVLYEGAWLRHGRPMRFKGNEFANVFSHFAPPDWRGPNDQQARSYYGVQPDRLTTLADSPGVFTSDFFRNHPPKKDANNDEL